MHVYMYIYMNIHMYANVRRYEQKCTNTNMCDIYYKFIATHKPIVCSRLCFTYLCMFICIYTHVIRIRISTYIYIFILIFLYMYIILFIDIYTHVYIYIYIFIYI
jgi:hypothetical protein